MDYSIESLSVILNQFLTEEYVFVADPREILSGSRKVFLRHDIDVDLEYAIQVAEMESRLGIRAHYYLMLDSPFYNLLEELSFSHLKRLQMYSEFISLHMNVYRDSSQSLDQAHKQILRSVFVFEQLAGKRIQTISFHQPSKVAMRMELDSFSLYNVYLLNQSQKVTYFSDTNQSLDILALQDVVRKGGNIHLLIHPVWWCSALNSKSSLWPSLVVKRLNYIQSLLQGSERTYDPDKAIRIGHSKVSSVDEPGNGAPFDI
jgi:hypothetical protein